MNKSFLAVGIVRKEAPETGSEWSRVLVELRELGLCPRARGSPGSLSRGVQTGLEWGGQASSWKSCLPCTGFLEAVLVVAWRSSRVGTLRGKQFGVPIGQEIGAYPVPNSSTRHTSLLSSEKES